MSRVLVVVPSVRGHRLTYVRHILEHLPPGTKVGLLLRSADRVLEEFGPLLRRGIAETDLVESTDFSPRGVIRAARHYRATLVVAPDGDRLAIAIGLRWRWEGPPIAALVLRRNAQPRRSAALTHLVSLARRVALGRASSMAGVEVLDLVAPYSTGGDARNGVQDPVELGVLPRARDDARARFGLDPERIWVGVVGALQARKNVPAIVSALSVAPGEFGLLAMGTCDERTLIALDAARLSGLSVVSRIGFASDADIDAAILACDVVLTLYSNEGPSGIVAKSLALGTPVVHGLSEELRTDLQGWQSTFACATLSPDDVCRSVRLAADFGRAVPADFARATPQAFAQRLLGGHDGRGT